MKKLLDGNLMFSLLGYVFGCFMLFCFCGGVIGSWTGCITSFKEPAQIVQKTDMYYAVVTAIVTDPAIYDLLTPEQLKDVYEIDETYKHIRKIATTLAESQSVVRTMAQCGIDICDILDELDTDEEKQKEIAALRIALKIFMTTLVEPPLELVE